MQRAPPPGYFLRSPPRSPDRSPPRMPSPAFRPRSRSPSRHPPAYARSASQPRPRPRPPPSPPLFYRPAPSPPGFRRLSPPRMAPNPPPYSPPRSYSQARRSPPRFRVSPRRSPPPSSAPSPSFQRGRSLARDDFRPPPDQPEPVQWRAKPQPQQQQSPALAQRVLSLSAFCGEVLDARGKLLPSSQRPRSPGLPIPVPLLRGENPKQYEAAFRDWLLRRKNLLVDDLRNDAAKERVFRFSFAYSRLPVSAWNKPAPSASSSSHRLEPSATRSDPRDSSQPTRRLAADPMPPRAKPFKRSRSAEPKKDDRVQPEVEPEPEAKRPRKASPRDPRVRHASSDVSGGASTTVTGTSGRLRTRGGDGIDGTLISDLEAARTRSPLPGPASAPSTRVNGTAGANSKPQTRSSREAITAAAPAKKKPDATSKAVDAVDEVLPKWAAALLQRLQALEGEVRGLRRQLAAHGPGGAFKDGIGEADSIKVDRVDISTEKQPAVQLPDGEAPRAVSDPVKTRLAAAYNDLNDEILLNEGVVADSDELVRNMMATDERQARELQGQIQELRAAIEEQKSKRDASLAALVAHCWRGRRAALEELLAVPLKTQDAAAIQQACHAKCARLAAQAKLQGRPLPESGPESTTADAGAAAAARSRLEREQEAEYALLLTASEHVRNMVGLLLDGPP